jgi:hypothetical protein
MLLLSVAALLPPAALSLFSVLFVPLSINDRAHGLEAPSAWTLFAYSIRLLPIERSAPAPTTQEGYDLALTFRLELINACVAATTDRSERFICTKIPRYESDYREDVGRCRTIGKAGDRSAWQIVPRSRAEADRLCVTVEADAKFAIERIRESRRACANLPKQEQLAVYTRGSCTSEEGKRLSRIRFPTDAEVKRAETEQW